MQCKWITLLPEVIFGAEGEGEGQGEQEGQSSEGQGSTGSESQNSEGNDEGDGEGDEGDNDGKDTAGLKSALEKERKAARDAQRELKRLQKAQSDRELAEKSDLEKAQLKEQQATERAQRLAEGLLKRDLNAAITKVANELKFVDTDDALNGVDRSLLTFEQDEDDPTNITIDTKTVEKAVKALAAKKPHFLKQGTSDGNKSGSPMGGSKRTNGGEKTQAEILRERYPALR